VKLPRELVVRGIVLRDDHQARRAAVKAMDDPWALFAAYATQILDVVQQRVDQRAAGMAGRWVDDHTGRLVHHDEVTILVDDLERQILGFRGWRHWFGNLDGHDLSGFDRLVRFGRPPRHLDVPVLNQPLNLRSGVRAEDRRQKAIDSLARAVLGNREVMESHEIKELGIRN
jgi:hypothetical protein